MKTSLLTIFAVLSLFNPQISTAQDLDTVTINGLVTDQNSAVIVGATITVTLMQTGAIRTTTSNASGNFKLIQLPSGTYSVRISATGFATQQLDSVATVSSQTLTLNFTLTTATIEVDPVVVTTADATPIDTKRTIVGATLSAGTFELLPVPSRSVLDLIFTLPGLSEEPLSTRDLAEDRNTAPNNTPAEAGSFALAGQPAYSNNLTIDGLDNNDDRGARERFQPPIEAVEEVQVITNQFSAEYGRASGGRINLTTRSGSNYFRGRGFYFFRDESLNANSFRNNSLGLSRLPLQEHVGGLTLSGPVNLPRMTLRSVFFIAYESNRVLDSALIDTLVPLAQNKLFPLSPPSNPDRHRLEDVNDPALATEIAPYLAAINTPAKSANLTSRMDHQFNQMHNLAFVYQRGRLTNLRQFSGGNRLAEALQGKKQDSDAVSFSDNFVVSTNAVNQARFQYSRLAPAFSARGNRPVVLIALNDSLIADDPERRSGTLIAGSSSSGSSDRREIRYQLQEIFSLLTGDHSLKFGFDHQRVRSEFIDLGDLTGTYNFASAGDFLAGNPSRFRQTFQTTSTQSNIYGGFFVQDEWQILPNLLISYGIRYERESIINDLNNFGPRFSVAYNPFDAGKLVLRFGGGLFYNRALLRTIDDFTLGKQQLFFDSNSLQDPQTGKLLSAEQRRAFIAANLEFPNTLKADSDLVKRFGVLNKNFSRRLDTHLRIPESYQLNLGIERDLGSGFTTEANLTWTRAIHLWREFNVNAPRLPTGYANFTSYLASRDFANFKNPLSGNRPIYNAASAGELVRFGLETNAANPNAISRIVEFGVPISIFNLNSLTSTTAVEVALAALNEVRPDPSRAEIEQLISAGNSFYRGFTIELRRQGNLSEAAFRFSFRTGYTFSKLVDDGVVNTSDALRPGDFRAERVRSLLDRRHRFVFSGTFHLPRWFGLIQLSAISRVTSGAPFNISIGGSDRNLDDVGNDRPNFDGNPRSLRWRSPGSTIDPALVDAFSLPPLGQSGNLPRNAGNGPGQFLLDLNLTREFRFTGRLALTPVIEFDNVLNKTLFSFGSEFINFNALSTNATEEQRQAFLNSFLLATRTMRPRQIRVGLRIQF